MAKFRKKPVVVEAVQYVGQPVVGVEPFTERGIPRFDEFDTGEETYPVIWTANGKVRVYVGDWVVRDPASGDVWPVKKNIFAATYEPVEEETP